MIKELPSTENLSSFIFKILKNDLPAACTYHNYNHTEQTVNAAAKLCKMLDISHTDIENLLIAAWFHDTGYTKKHEGHEEESVLIMKQFFGDHLPKENLRIIEALILSTKVNHESKNLLEDILHDADYINIGKKKFGQNAQLLRIEWEQVASKFYTDLEWAELQLQFLISKNFKTSAAIKKYGNIREENIRWQRELIETLKGEHKKNELKEQVAAARTNKEGRGIETLYRSVYDYHINLSSIADNKANIMISVNTIIISIIITLFGSGYTFTGDGIASVRFVFPMLFLVLSSLVSVVFAILSARPNVTTKEKYELKNKSSSILFFGNFAQLKLTEFVDYIKILKDQKEELYDSMSTDIYYLGGVLVKKYKLLTWSYNVFMLGLVLCAVSFIVIMAVSY